MCAFGAAPLTANIGHLALYEGWLPVDPDPLAPPAELVARLEAMLDAGNPEAALDTTFRDVLRFGDEEIGAYRARPSWAGRVAAAHTIPREFRAMAEAVFDPEEASKIAVPTLLRVGEVDWHGMRGEADTVAAALPDARIVVLAGQGHLADVLAPERVAEELFEFLGVV